MAINVSHSYFNRIYSGYALTVSEGTTPGAKYMIFTDNVVDSVETGGITYRGDISEKAAPLIVSNCIFFVSSFYTITLILFLVLLNSKICNNL